MKAQGATQASEKRGDDESAARLQRILDRAVALFITHGFDRTTLDDVAIAARVGKQTIYEYFATKEDLFVAAVQSQTSLHQPKLRLRGELASVLTSYATMLVEGFSSSENFGLLRLNIVLADRFPSVMADLHDQRRQGAQELAVYLKEQQRQGKVSIRPEESLDIATRLGGVAAEPVRRLLGHPDDTGARNRDASDAVALFLKGAFDQGDTRRRHTRIANSPGAEAASAPQHSAKYNALVDVAADWFLKLGFDDMNVATLCERYGVSKATIYRQFESKDGLFRQAIHSLIDRLMREPIKRPTTLQVEKALAQIAADALRRHLGSRSIRLHRLLIDEAVRFPELGQRFYDAQIDRLSKPLSEVFIRAGKAAPSNNTVRAFHTLATFGVRYLTNPVRPSSDEQKVLAQQTARIFVRGIVRDSPQAC